jgi:hypothetical protein
MAEIIHDGVKYSTFYGAVISDELHAEMQQKFPSDIPNCIDQSVYFNARENARAKDPELIEMTDTKGNIHEVFILKRENFPEKK